VIWEIAQRASGLKAKDPAADNETPIPMRCAFGIGVSLFTLTQKYFLCTFIDKEKEKNKQIPITGKFHEEQKSRT
jgi:hypothetical protein